MEFSFSIGGQDYAIPEVINLQLFERAFAWDITDDKNLKPFVSTISDCPLSQLNLVDKETFELILAVAVSRLDFNETELNVNIGLYKLKPFTEFTFGEFIDIDLMLSSGGIKDNVVELAQKLYGFPESVALNTDIKLVWKAVMQIVEWRAQTYRDYVEFFGEASKEETEETEIDTSRIQFMWYEAVYVLADEKFLNISEVTDRPYKEALNFLTYKKHQADKARLEQLKRKNDLQRRVK